MIQVAVYKQGNFPVNAKKLKDVVAKTLKENGIVSDCTVDIAIVNETKMDELNKKYYKDKRSLSHNDEDYEHPVFTFPSSEGENFIFPPDGKMHLGEIVISFPFVVKEARETGKLIDDVAVALAAHGAMHLVGIHHD